MQLIRVKMSLLICIYQFKIHRGLNYDLTMATGVCDPRWADVAATKSATAFWNFLQLITHYSMPSSCNQSTKKTNKHRDVHAWRVTGPLQFYPGHSNSLPLWGADITIGIMGCCFLSKPLSVSVVACNTDKWMSSISSNLTLLEITARK